MERTDLKELRPKGAVGIYLVEGDKILLYLRNSTHAGGTWCPLGGHIEYGESFLEAARREVKEEAGIDTEDIEVMGVTSDVYDDEKRHYITVHTRPKRYTRTPSLMEPDKFDDMSRFHLSELPENLFPANRRFLSLNPDCLCDSGKKYKNCHGK